MSENNYLEDFFAGTSVFITGVCGTIGSALLARLMKYDVSHICGIDNNESELFSLNEKINDKRVKLFLGDIRDREQLAERMHEIDIVLHTAAYKHVGTCESSPRDAVLTNVIGTQNIIDTARQSGVKRLLFSSSDKAVNPTNVMGSTKLLGERLISSAAMQAGESGTVFASTRFGNVLGSRGSVVPIFKQQIAEKGPLTLTSPDMNRFVMTTDEAVHLVLDSVRRAEGGEVFVTKMHAVRISDLANIMIEVLSPKFGYKPEQVQITQVGPRPAEKFYEELINSEEVRRTVELDKFFVILPALFKGPASRLKGKPGKKLDLDGGTYRSDSQPYLSGDKLKDYLINNRVI